MSTTSLGILINILILTIVYLLLIKVFIFIKTGSDTKHVLILSKLALL